MQSINGAILKFKNEAGQDMVLIYPVDDIMGAYDMIERLIVAGVPFAVEYL